MLLNKLKSRFYEFLWNMPETLSKRDFHNRWTLKTKNLSKRVQELTAEQINEINAIWYPYKKLKNYNAIAFYSGITGNFSPKYIPDDIFYSDIDFFFNNWRMACELDNKNIYDRMLLPPPSARIMLHNLQLCRTICHRINGFWQSPDYTVINNDDVVSFVMEESSVFLKVSKNSCGGKGVKLLEVKDKSRREVLSILNAMGDNLIVQAPIKQHASLSKLNPSSVNTIRLISLLKKDGSVKVYSAILRIGVGGSYVDNASSGGITCGINEDGTLKSIAYKTNGDSFHKHPDTGVRFNSIKLPEFDSLKEDIKKIHPAFAHSRLISWDVALDENDNYILIEPNLKRGELDFHQLNNGPLFGDDTEEILKEVYNK